MASINLRNGQLFFDFRVYGARCREYTKLTDTPTNRRKMEKVLAKIETDLSLGRLDYGHYFPGSKMVKRLAALRADAKSADAPSADSESDLPLFSDFAVTWMQDKQVEWRASHKTSVESALSAHLLPAFGEVPLDKITRESILSFRTLMASKHVRMPSKPCAEGRRLTPSTINKVIGILRMILDEAAMRHGIQNPCLSLKRLKVQRKDIELFTMDELQAILTRVRPAYRHYLTFRFFTGVRSGEVHGLKWKHIDFERRQVLIRETYVFGRTEYTKNDGSQREIHISQPVFDALSALRPAGYAEDPSAFADRYVFCSRNGLPIDNKNFNDRVWKPLLRNLGLKYRRPYQMRHTCATLWLAAGESPEWIARQLGHTTTEMLFRTYSRYVPNLTRRDGRAFDTLVTNVVNGGVAAAANDEFLVMGRTPGFANKGASNV